MFFVGPLPKDYVFCRSPTPTPPASPVPDHIMEGDFSPQPDYKGKGFFGTCVIFKGFYFTMDHLISITSNCVTNIFNECKSVGFLFPKKDIFLINYLFFLGGGVIFELMTLKNKKGEISNFLMLTLAKNRNL